MKKMSIGLMLIAALALSVAPAVAGDTFHALRTLSPVELSNLTPLADDQLAAVEGGHFRDGGDFRGPRIIIINIIYLTQINVCEGCDDVTQQNIATTVQDVTFISTSPPSRARRHAFGPRS
jgi:hypothetical protein